MSGTWPQGATIPQASFGSCIRVGTLARASSLCGGCLRSVFALARI